MTHTQVLKEARKIVKKKGYSITSVSYSISFRNNVFWYESWFIHYQEGYSVMARSGEAALKILRDQIG